MRVQAAEHLNYSETLAFIRRRDRGRARYVKTYFHRDIADVFLYDLTINTDHLAADEVVRLIGHAVLQRKYLVDQEQEQAA